MKKITTWSNKLLTLDSSVRTALVVMSVLVAVGTLVYHQYEGWSYLDSVYFSVITLTTIGYGDMHPTHPETKLFTILFVLFGVGLVFYIFATINKHLFESEKEEIKRIEHDLEDLTDLLQKKK